MLMWKAPEEMGQDPGLCRREGGRSAGDVGSPGSSGVLWAGGH